MSDYLGKHVLAEFYGCDRERLNDESFLKAEGESAARSMGATIVCTHSHRYEPHGVSVVIILAESHLSLHTWPEFKLASVDIFVCNPRTDPNLAKTHLHRALKAEKIAELEVERGRLDHIAQMRGRVQEPVFTDS